MGLPSRFSWIAVAFVLVLKKSLLNKNFFKNCSQLLDRDLIYSGLHPPGLETVTMLPVLADCTQASNTAIPCRTSSIATG